jgi:hypothetical protein
MLIRRPRVSEPHTDRGILLTVSMLKPLKATAITIAAGMAALYAVTPKRANRGPNGRSHDSGSGLLPNAKS